MKLTNLQKLFANSMQDETEQHFLHEIVKNHLSPKERLEIYRGSMQSGLLNALTETFPLCKKIVGEEFFNALARQFIDITPSHSPDLTQYGKTFPEFISNFKPAEELPYLADVAKFEWIWEETLNGPNNQILDVQRLQGISNQQNIVFHLIENGHLYYSAYPILHIIEVVQDENSDATVSLDEGEDKLFIWRQDLEMRAEHLSDPQWEFLQAIASHTKFGNIAEHLLQNK